MTPQQKRLYDIIKGDLDATGVCPSFEEMRVWMGLASKSGIHQLLDGLEERGHIRRLRHRARAIEIIERNVTVDDLLSRDAGGEAIAGVVLAAKRIKIAPWHKEPTVTISENSYQTLLKALGKLRAA